MNQGPAYYGDLDETDGKLLEDELQAEEEGELWLNITDGDWSDTRNYRLGGSILKST